MVDLVFHEFGVVTGLIGSSFLIIIGITLVTELAALTVSVRRGDGHLAPLVRVVGYGIPSVLFALVSMYNVGVLIAGVQAASFI